MIRHLRSTVAGALLAALPLLLSGCGNSEARKPTALERRDPPVAVTTALAEERRLPGELDVTGTLMADAQTDVASEGSGRVVEVLVERGTVLRTGAVVARLQPDDAANQLREAEATAAQTQARLGLAAGQAFEAEATPDVRRARVGMERAQADYERYATLVEQGAVSRSEYDLKRAEVLTAREQYEAARNEARQLYQTLLAQRARVNIARKALEDVVIRAPFDGLVAERHVNVGQFLQRGARVATIVRVDPLRVELTIPESAVASVRKGQRVSFAVQTYPDRRFAGTIAYVGPSLKADARALVVEALVPNADGRLQPGLFATASIELPAVKPAVLVPLAAVQTEAGVSRAYVVKNERAEQRLVQLGREVGDRVEVLRGIAAGEAVVAQWSSALVDGAEVALKTPTAQKGGT